ncbi:MAG: glycosyltransferase [Omnitrophica bacterium]|nr:glycosyltransferase [Candidatus Omnitrophota bacterium]
MKKARVLYITYNGVCESIFQSQCLPYLKGLRKAGYGITLLSYERGAIEDAEHAELLGNLGIKWYKLKYHKKPRIIASGYDFLLGMTVSFFITLTGKISIIHARATHGAIIGMPAAKFLRRKFIFDTRGLDSEEYVDGNLIAKNSFLHNALFRIEKYLFSRSDSIVLLSHNAKALLTEKGLGRYLCEKSTHVIPCVTDLDLFNANVNKTVRENGSIKFLYVGSVGTWYMIEEMFDFFLRAKNRLKGSKFTIFTQSDRNTMRLAEKMIKARDAVRIKFAEYKSMPGHISDSDVGLCFIKPVSSKRASSPTKVGEYLACGLPVVINSGIGDTEDLIRNNGVGVVVDDFSGSRYDKAIFELENLLKDKDVFKRCRLTAEKHFSLNDAVNTYDIIYSNLTAAGRSGR